MFYIRNGFLNDREFMALGALSSNNQIDSNDKIKVRYEYEVCQREWWEMINLDQPDFPELFGTSETIGQSQKVSSLLDLTAEQNKTIQVRDCNSVKDTIFGPQNAYGILKAN